MKLKATDWICFTARILSWGIILFLLISLSSSTASVNRAPSKSRREVITARHGAVATDDGRCSIIGRNVLGDGGHAVDAAVAAALCLGVVSPASSGIGGGAFMLVRSANGTTQAFDMRESAPMLASQVLRICGHFPSFSFHFVFHTWEDLSSERNCKCKGGVHVHLVTLEK